MGRVQSAKKWPLALPPKQLCYEMALMMKELTVTLALHMENLLQSYQAENQETKWKAKKPWLDRAFVRG